MNGVIFDCLMPVGTFSSADCEDEFGHRRMRNVKIHSFYVNPTDRTIKTKLSYKLLDNDGKIIFDFGRGRLRLESLYLNKDTAFAEKAFLMKGSYEN